MREASGKSRVWTRSLDSLVLTTLIVERTVVPLLEEDESGFLCGSHLEAATKSKNHQEAFGREDTSFSHDHNFVLRTL